MEKLIRIEFELKNPQEVIIYGYDEFLKKKEIGCIFTPAGSGQDEINCIQVCGVSEAFDFWGCARYKIPITRDDRKKVIDGLKGKETPLVAAKDIQLMFDIETIPRDPIKDRDFIEGCCRCYNKPCTCENKSDIKTQITATSIYSKEYSPNPYNIKREEELPIIYDKDIKGKYEYEDKVLIKKDGEDNN